jgi:hypothetical protein
MLKLQISLLPQEWLVLTNFSSFNFLLILGLGIDLAGRPLRQHDWDHGVRWGEVRTM